MCTLVQSEMVTSRTAIIAFVASERTLAGQFPALGNGLFLTSSTIGGVNAMQRLFLERGSDGAQNQILFRSQIAREFRLERLPNAARRQLFACADGSADQPRHRGFEDTVRDCGAG